MPAPGDQELVARCLAGGEDAWADLVDRYSGLIYSVACKYGLDREDAAEVFQNVCLQWWQSLGQVHDVERLAGWLATVTGRAAWRVIEGRQQARRYQEPDAEEALLGARSPEQLPEEMVLAAERSAGLRRAVSRLDDRCRALVNLLFFVPEPPDYAAIAAEFGLAEGSIGAMRKRCLERLRREIMQKPAEGAFFEGGEGTTLSDKK